MADKMTLIDVRDRLRNEVGKVEADSMKYAECAYHTPSYVLEDLADAIDAHIAAMGEPVGFILRSVTPPYDYWPESFVLGEPQEDESENEHWEPIYARPPASGDWDKVREVIAILDADGDEWGCAAKLTAALPENAE